MINFNKFTNNWKVVLISIMGAATFWLFRALNKSHSALISYPIEFVFNVDRTVIMNTLPTTIKIDVSSGGWNLFRRTLIFSIDPIQVELDNPSEVNFLTQSFLSPIVEDQLKGLTINYIVTDTLFLSIERKITKRMILKVDSLSLPLEEDYQLMSNITIQPDHVVLTGPKSIINSFESDFYITLDENNIDEDFNGRVEVPIVFEDLIKSYPSEVNVSFEVDKFKNVKIGVPIILQNFPSNRVTTLLDSIVDVTYRVKESFKEDFSSEDFYVVLDYDFLKTDSLGVPVLIKYPDTLRTVSIDSQKVRFRYENEE
jgi:YbbR domain-containing protein